MVDFDKNPERENRADFGESFDYDPTAEASLSEQTGPSDSAPTFGSPSGSGPGWDTYAGVGNGPGWGETPSYPAPLNPAPLNPAPPNPMSLNPMSLNLTESYPVAGYPEEPNATQSYPTAHGQQAYPPQSPIWGQGEGNNAGNQQSPHYPQYPANPQSSQNFQHSQNFQPYQQPVHPQFPQGQYPYAAQPGYGYLPQPSYFSPSSGDAPFGRDPITGEALSDKSKVAAGLLQLFLGGFGAGRFYIGSNGVAIVQLLLLVFGWLTVFFGVGVLVLLGLGVWVIIDAIMMFVGNVKDGSGRRLRN